MQRVANAISGSTKQEESNAFRGRTLTGIPIGKIADPLIDRTQSRFAKTESYLLIGNEIGRGGMGVVYKATQVVENKEGRRVIEKEVAVKVINPDGDFGTDPETKRELYESFITEVRLVSRLEHENIVRVVDFGETVDGRPFYVMEYLEGKNLDEILKKRALAWDELKPIVIQVCHALQATHEYRENGSISPIIHRDIKPMNIFITTNNGEQRIKVLDFGLAKILAAQSSESSDTTKGTPDYMSPEQARGQALDHRTDIYAIGVVMYQALIGRTPFRFGIEKNVEDFERIEEYEEYFREECGKFLLRVVAEKPKQLREINPDISQEVERIVAKCLEKNLEDRYNSVRELIEDIRKCNGKEISKVIIDPEFLELIEEEERRYTEQPKTEVVPSPNKKSGRIVRGLMYGTVAATIIGGVLFGLSHREQISPPQRPPVAPEVIQISSQAVEMPMVEPIREPEKREYEITLRTNVDDVGVFLDSEEMCTIANNQCSLRLSESSESVELVLRKSGYVELRQIVFVNQDQTIDVEMERVQQPRRREQRRRAPLITSE
ncbi:serine/threonine protein kinase [Candidatus Micrarchaeota archaeon]|nr:serine/threonine protein kinase [Candidatus Micrarchaeota archaeon]